MKQLIFILFLIIYSLNLFAHNEKNGFEFAENKGQWPSNVVYHTKLIQGDIYFEKNKVVFDLINSQQLNEMFNIKHNSPQGETNNSANPLVNPRTFIDKENPLMRNAYSMSFLGANSSATISGNQILDKRFNYAIGNDQTKWASDVRAYREIEYHDLYDGINMQFYSTVKNLKYDFIVSPGANPSDIKIEYDGTNGIHLDENGSLVINLENDEVKEYRPVAYQYIDGKQVSVACKFVIEGNKVNFAFPEGYDSEQELIIDPVILFSTVVGSTADNWGFSATYDQLGNLYAAGIAFGSGYPTTIGSFAGGSFDISVTKWTSDGQAIAYSTYIGGSVDDEMPHSLVTNSNNELILLGTSSSSDYPTTAGAYDQSFNGGTGIYANMWGSVYAAGCDIVLTQLDASGALANSTFVGGSDNDGINETMVYNYSDQGRGEVVLDGSGNIYVCTSAQSTDFPGVVSGNSGNQDAFIFKLTSDFSTISWATYYGGSNDDTGYSIRLNSLGEVYICGGTVSSNLNKVAGGLLTTYQGSWDGYIAKFNGTTGALLNDTYIGTSSYDQTFILEIDNNDEVYMIGQTLGNYSVINAVYSNADSPQFIHKLSSDLTTTIYSTKFGNGSLASGGLANRINISPTAFLVDDCGNVYVSGWGGGSNSWSYGGSIPYDPQAGGTVQSMPITSTGTEQTTTDNSDFYFFVMERDAQSLLYATYFGDPVTLEHTDGGTSRFDPKGVVYQSVCATCGSGSFPSNNALFPGNPAGDVCNLGVIKFEMYFPGVEASANVPANVTMCSTDYTVDFSSTGSAPQHEWLFGDGGSSTDANPTYTYATVGTYNVTYIAIDPASCNLRDTAYFTVELIQAPTFNATFNLPVIPPCSDPSSVTVNADISGTGIDSTQWNMGDGTIIPDVTSISYSYSNEGIYPIEVIAWDLTCNISDTIRDTLNFITSMSTAAANAPADTTLCSNPPFDIPFTSDGTTPDVYWDFGDGNTSTNANPTNTYVATGIYNVMFVAIDSNTCNIRDTAYFNVELIQAPTFNASFNLPVIPPCSDPTAVTVNADISGTGIDSTQWDMGDGTIYTDLTSISHDYTTEGLYPIEVIAWDLTCNVSDTIRDTLNFITVLSTATANAPADTTLCSNPPFDIPFTSDGATPDVYWDFGDGNTSTNTNPINTYTAVGIYNVMFVAIDSSTCNIADTVYFNVELIQAPTFNASFNLPIIPPCSDPNAVTVNADVSGSGIDSTQWNMGDGTIYTDLTTISHDYIAEGIYPIEVIAWNLTCNVSDTIRDTLHFITTMSTASANGPADTTLCSNPPYEIPFISDGTTPDVFWDFGDGNTSTDPNPTNTFVLPGIYNVMFIAIDSNTCNIADTSEFTVELIQAPTFSVNFNLPVIPPCSDPTSVTINADIAGTGIDSTVWNMGDGTIYSDSTSITYNYSNQGIYDIVITAWDMCGNDTSIFETFHFITDNSTASAYAPEDTTLCTVPPFSISFSSTGTNPDQLWDFGDGSTSTDANPTHLFADSGSYVVTYIAIDPNTCNVRDTATFNVTLIEAEHFSADLNFNPPPPCSSDSMLVEMAFNGTAADSVVWNMGNGDVFSTFDLSYYYTEGGNYSVSMTAYDFTCNISETFTESVLFVKSVASEVIIPNVFTPNGDGDNDNLHFLNVDGTQLYRVTIFNRWGRKVFETEDSSTNWNGKIQNDGSDAHDGVYFFEIIYTDLCSDEEKIETGFVHLMR